MLEPTKARLLSVAVAMLVATLLAAAPVRGTTYIPSQEPLSEEAMLDRSVSMADAVVLADVLPTSHVERAILGDGMRVRAREVLRGDVGRDSFNVGFRPHSWTSGGYGASSDPTVSSDRVRLLFLVGSTAKGWVVNDGPYEFAGGVRTLVGDEIERTRQRILAVVRRQSLDSLAVRADCIVVGARVDSLRGARCRIDGQDRGCALVAVQRHVAGSCPAETLALYEPLPQGSSARSLMFLISRGAGVHQAVSFEAGMMALDDTTVRATGESLESILQGIRRARAGHSR
jgi:hypothetical protein